MVRQLGPRSTKALEILGACMFVAAAIYLIVAAGPPGVIAGGCMLAAMGLLRALARTPRRDTRTLRVVGDRVRLPRRRAYRWGLVLLCILGGSAMVVLGVVGISDPDPGVAIGKQSAPFGLLLGTIGLSLGLALLVAVALGRGSSSMTAEEVSWTPWFGRRRSVAWDHVSTVGPSWDHGVIRIGQTTGRGLEFQSGSFSWTVDTMVALLETMRAGTPGERQRLVADIAAGGPAASPEHYAPHPQAPVRT